MEQKIEGGKMSTAISFIISSPYWRAPFSNIIPKSWLLLNLGESLCTEDQCWEKLRNKDEKSWVPIAHPSFTTLTFLSGKFLISKIEVAGLALLLHRVLVESKLYNVYKRTFKF